MALRAYDYELSRAYDSCVDCQFLLGWNGEAGECLSESEFSFALFFFPFCVVLVAVVVVVDCFRVQILFFLVYLFALSWCERAV